MGREGVKIAYDIRLKYAKLCFEGKLGLSTAARELGIDPSTMAMWVALYREQGELAFLDTGRNQVYSDELRQQSVSSYLRGEGSLKTVSAKYGLRNSSQLKAWIKMYNNGEDFSCKMSGGSRMTTSRKTTKEERIQIVKDCIARDCDYGQTAITYSVSYQQVYGWVKRYRELGEAGLEDRRDRRRWTRRLAAR